MATVSRVLRQRGSHNDATAERIVNIARQLKYAPSGRAASGTDTLPRTLGMLIAHNATLMQHDTFFAEVVAGASRAADERMSRLLIAPLPADDNSTINVLQQRDVHGLIVGGVPLPDRLVAVLRTAALPVVWIGHYRHPEPVLYVAPDNEDGGRQAAEHLLQLGHTHIAIITGPTTIHTFHDRLHGVQNALGAHAHVTLRQHQQFDEGAGYHLTSALFDEGNLPTAILALSDWMALGAMRALRERGMHVPHDVSVVGYSDVPPVALLDPPLTTVHIPQQRLGALAVDLLHLVLRGELHAPLGMTVPVTLNVRASTAVPRTVSHA